MPIHRTIKNVVKNFTYAEVKVREATSNDPWGPSTTLMSEIADLTYNVMAFAEIMQMIWKRLNDHGKNWRHVYKSLVLLDYLLKTGHERVAQQCRENLLTIQTLKDFQYIEDGKDHGQNVREKSKALVMLLKDDERFKNERTKALAAKERYAQNTGAATGKLPHSTSDRYLYGTSTQSSSSPPLNSELEAVRPSSYGEEDLQLQLALAMSKEEHDEEVKRRKGDELKLQMAIEESRKATQQPEPTIKSPGDRLLEFDSSGGNSASHMSLSATWDGQLSRASGDGPAAGSSDPWSPTPAATNTGVMLDPWGMPVAQATVSNNAMAGFNDPWASSVGPSANTFEPVPSAAAPQSLSTGLSPWDPITANPAPNGAHSFPSATSVPPAVDDEFDLLSSRSKSPPSVSGGSAFDPVGASLDSGLAASKAWDMTDLTMALGDNKLNASAGATGADGGPKKKTAAEFLGQNANLVNLNDLISRPPPSTVINPFAMTTTTRTQSPAANLFATRAQQEEQSRRVPINQMPTSSGFSAATSFQQPGVPAASVVPGVAWQSPAAMAPSAVGVGMYAQPTVGQPIMQPAVGLQPYPQSQNPFL